MNCREFEGLLEGLLEGTLEREAHARCVRHAASCAPCGELVEPMGPMLAPVAVEPPADLLPRLLRATSGAPARSRWAEMWRQWMLRPRFASEVAYLGVVVLRLAAVRLDSRVVLQHVRTEAGILLDRATSLLEKEKP